MRPNREKDFRVILMGVQAGKPMALMQRAGCSPHIEQPRR
jgi:hypothetical protein